MQRISSAGRWSVGHPWVFIVLAIFGAVGLWAYSTRTQKYEVRAVFDEAVSVSSGLDVRVDGLDAGKVKSVENEGGKAVITLGIDDDRVWPLHQGATATLRFGSTIGNGTRIIDVDPGPEDAPELPDGGIIRNQDTVETTEFDDLFDTFDAKTRKDLQGTLDGTGDTFGSRSGELADAVTATPDGLESVGGLADDVSRDEVALKAFVANTDRVTRTLAARRDDLSSLVEVAAQTFRAFASRTEGITGSLDRFPTTVRETRSTLSRLDTSVDGLDALLADVKPGAVELSRLSRDLRPALADLRRTVPDAVQTFRVTRRAAPATTRLLQRAQPFSKQAAPVLADLAPMVGCLRPYAPEIAGLLSTWTSSWQLTDQTGHVGRLTGAFGPSSVTSSPPTNSADFVRSTGSGYALVKAPGYNGGSPWYQPQCGITADGTNPEKDPEDGK